MRSPRARALAGTVAPVLAGVLVLVAGCSSGDDGGAAVEPMPLPTAPAAVAAAGPEPAQDQRFAAYYEQQLAWEPCEPPPSPEGGQAPRAEGFDCAELAVPLDWAEPAAERIEVAVNRLRAEDPDARLGSLLLNPGGPGVSGVDYAFAARDVVGTPLRRAFDVVGFDPRGVARSSPVECLDDPAEVDRLLASEPTPDDPAEVEEVRRQVQGFTALCAQRSRDLLPHVDTASAARDLDVLRAALGDERLSYLGGSYGTYLGAWYAELFPQRVGRLVLDGAVDPTLDAEGFARGQAEGFATALESFVDACAEEGPCPLRGGPQAARDQVESVLQQADARPLRTDDPDRPLTEALAATGIALGLYDERFWPQLTEALGAALRGDGTDLRRLADLYYQRQDDGTYPTDVLDPNAAVACADREDDRTVEQVAADAEELGNAVPPFGRFLGWSALTCVLWPVDAVLEPRELRGAGADPVLVVGTTRDPATPYVWAEALAEQLESARLLTYDADGHTAYGRGSGCVDEAVEGYLLAGALPAEGTRC